MPLNLASPGIKVREVDLTVGRVDPASAKVGGLVAPLAQGPVELPTLIGSEKDLLDNFGKPYGNDKHYEHWLSASSYLAYGAGMRIVRSDSSNLWNAYVGTGSSIKVKSTEHYEQLGYDESTISSKQFVSKNPGSWANGIRIAVIDARGDQVLTGISTSGVSVFTATIDNRSATIDSASDTTLGINTASISIGQEVRGEFISAGTTVTGISTTGFITISNPTSNTEGGITIPLDIGSTTVTAAALAVGAGVTQSLAGKKQINQDGTTTDLTGSHLKGIVTEIGVDQVSVKVLSKVTGGVETPVDYQESGTWAFTSTGNVAIHTAGQSVSYGSTAYTGQSDWFNQQTFATSTKTVGGTVSIITENWNTVADRPQTSQYTADRAGRFDEVHVVVIDGDGDITGNAGTILEKHLNLSKAKDAEFSAGTPSYWRSYLKTNSAYVFGGDAPSTTASSGYSSGFTLTTGSDWDRNAEGVIFDTVGAKDFEFNYGLNYDGGDDIKAEGALAPSLSDLITGYGLLENTEKYEIDFLIMGSANYEIDSAQALANKLIAVADVRKDAIAFISPYRKAFIDDTAAGSVTVNSDADITSNVLEFFSPITSSSYAIFDSGYKYMYDRYANTFRYVPLNADIAGLCARNDIDNFPWFSPAGTSRGAILNAVKLAYNPSKVQRDQLYSARINPVIVSPGGGITLFGDKTGLARASAFDRINVRRLFIYLEDAISAAARDQLFEFNDEITRTNFVNIVEPFLRDVQAKRGIQDYVVICDETNNTAAVIDNNEFVADIYIKPARSINFIGLTFVATRTGVSFEEVIGNV